MPPVSQERARDARLLVSFWSLEQLPCAKRYHVGQLSVAQYIDSRVDRGASHLAVICDSEVLKGGELERTYEVASAITSMCVRPVSIRTLTSLRRENGIDRSRAQRVALRLQELETRAKRYPAKPYLAAIGAWKREEIGGEQLLDATKFLTADEVKLLSADEASGLVSLLLRPPAWYDRFWFASAQFAINQISSEALQNVEKIEIVEGSRNRYVWLARLALERLCRAEFPKPRTDIELNLRPNIKADGPSGFMCLKEPESALFLNSSSQTIADFCDSASKEVADSICHDLLNRQEYTDRRALALETENLLASLQNRWIFASEKTGYTRVAQPQAIERTRKGVVSIHGVLSRGSWQKILDQRLSEASLICIAPDLGNLAPWRALQRDKVVEKAKEVMKQIDEVTGRNSQLAVSVVAHSFGTRVLGVALENFALKVDKIVLSGSILPRSFKWDQMLDSGQVGSLVNIAASQDWVVSLAGCLNPDWLGSSGRDGFATKHPRVVQRRVPDLAHSDVFDEHFFSRHLIPFLVEDSGEPQSFFGLYGSPLDV